MHISRHFPNLLQRHEQRLKIEAEYEKQQKNALRSQLEVIVSWALKQTREVSVKVPILWLGILHIYNIWNAVIRIAIYLVVRKFYLRGLFGC